MKKYPRIYFRVAGRTFVEELTEDHHLTPAFQELRKIVQEHFAKKEKRTERQEPEDPQ